jgi:pimeloyl-ACP methyl ester carboxylesterase
MTQTPAPNSTPQTPVAEIQLSAGTIRYHEAGQGEPIVFIHGLLVNGLLWRQVIPELARRYRCITPDWPLGSHSLPMNPQADISPRGVARLIAEFLAALGLVEPTLVANDTGGALLQLLLAGNGDAVGRAVLTPCDCFENFLPPAFRPLQYLSRIPGGLNLGLQPLRIPALRRLPIAFGWLSKRAVPRQVSDAWLAPYLSNRAIRRDTQQFVRAINKRDTLAAAEQLPNFRRPVLLAWAPEDRFFPLAHAERLSKLFPNARLEHIEDSYTFVSEDQPSELARLIHSFIGS